MKGGRAPRDVPRVSPTGRESPATDRCGSGRPRRSRARTTCSARWSWRCARCSSTTASAPSARARPSIFWIAWRAAASGSSRLSKGGPFWIAPGGRRGDGRPARASQGPRRSPGCPGARCRSCSNEVRSHQNQRVHADREHPRPHPGRGRPGGSPAAPRVLSVVFGAALLLTVLGLSFLSRRSSDQRTSSGGPPSTAKTATVQNRTSPIDQPLSPASTRPPAGSRPSRRQLAGPPGRGSESQRCFFISSSASPSRLISSP